MAIFNKKNKREAKEMVINQNNSTPTQLLVSNSDKAVLFRPRVTEKATEKSANDNVYVFEIFKNITKKDVASAIHSKYNVRPFKISIVKIPSKKIRSRGKVGFRSSGKKAYVYLKKGDKIEIV